VQASVGDYAPPAWGLIGGSKWSYEVVQQGEVVLARPIGSGAAAFCTIGRAKASAVVPDAPEGRDLDHLAISNASVSRMHAVLQVGASGSLWVADLRSGHGSRLNKARLPEGEFCRASPGSVLEVGQSSRKIVLLGPAEEDRVAPRRRAVVPQPAPAAPPPGPDAATLMDVPEVEEDGAVSLRREILALMGAGGAHKVTRSSLRQLTGCDDLFRRARDAQDRLDRAELEGSGEKAAAKAAEAAKAAATTAAARLRQSLGMVSSTGEAELLTGDLGEDDEAGGGGAGDDGHGEAAAFVAVDVDAALGRDWADDDDDIEDDGEEREGRRGRRLGVRRTAVAGSAPRTRRSGAAVRALPALLQGSSGGVSKGAAVRRRAAVKRPRHAGAEAGSGAAVEDEESVGRQLAGRFREAAEARGRAAAARAEAGAREAAGAANPYGLESVMARVQAAELRGEAATADARAQRLTSGAEVDRLRRLWRVATGREWQPPTEQSSPALADAIGASSSSGVGVGDSEPIEQNYVRLVIPAKAAGAPAPGGHGRWPAQGDGDGHPDDVPSPKRAKPAGAAAEGAGKQAKAAAALRRVRQLASAAKAKQLRLARDATAGESGERDPDLRRRRA